MQQITLTDLDRYNMLKDFDKWHIVQKSKFNSMLKSLNYKQLVDKEDVIMDFYMFTIEKDSKFHSWNGVFTGLMNYMKGLYNKLNVEHQPYDKFLYHEYVPEQISDYHFLSHTDKKFIAMLMCERHHVQSHGTIKNKQMVKLAQKFGLEEFMCVKEYKDENYKSKGVYRYKLISSRVTIIKYINGIILTLYPVSDIISLGDTCNRYISYLKNPRSCKFPEILDNKGRIKNYLELEYSKKCLYEIIDNLL